MRVYDKAAAVASESPHARQLAEEVTGLVSEILQGRNLSIGCLAQSCIGLMRITTELSLRRSSGVAGEEGIRLSMNWVQRGLSGAARGVVGRTRKAPPLPHWYK